MVFYINNGTKEKKMNDQQSKTVAQSSFDICNIKYIVYHLILILVTKVLLIIQ